MFTDRNLFLLAVVIYGLSVIYSVFLWRKGFRQDNRVNYFLLLAGFGFHTAAMFERGFSLQSCPVNNLYEATTFIAWTIVAAYLVLGLFHRVRFLGAFGLSAVAGLMYLSQEHDLKFHKLRAILSLLPPIERLEFTASRLMSVGFILLTLGLGVGAMTLEKRGGGNYFSDAKVIWSLFVWLLYLTLLVMRWKFSQVGRRFAWGTIASFVFVLLTFWGTNLL